MSELAETTQFLAGREPWSLLPPGEAAAYARRATASYVRRGTQILTAGSPNSRMHVIRSGAVEVRDADGVTERLDLGRSRAHPRLDERWVEWRQVPKPA